MPTLRPTALQQAAGCYHRRMVILSKTPIALPPDLEEYERAHPCPPGLRWRTLFHVTTPALAERILAEGFADVPVSRHRTTLGQPQTGGCFLSDQPVPPRELMVDVERGGITLAVRLTASEADLVSYADPSCRNTERVLSATRTAITNLVRIRNYVEYYVPVQVLNQAAVWVYDVTAPAPPEVGLRALLAATLLGDGETRDAYFAHHAWRRGEPPS
jgi:hypothetical protein